MSLHAGNSSSSGVCSCLFFWCWCYRSSSSERHTAPNRHINTTNIVVLYYSGNTICATTGKYSLTCLDADPTVHSISRSPLPAATGVRGPEGFGRGKFLPGRGYLLWNERHDRRDIVPPFLQKICGGTLGHVGETPGWRRAEEGGGGLSEERISGGDGFDGLHSLQVGWWTVFGGTPQHRQGGIPFCRRGGDM